MPKTKIYKTSIPKKNPEIIVENPELSDADKARLSGQLQDAMNREVARRNTPVSVPNISRVDSYEQTVDGKKYHFIDFHTADGKMYRTRQNVGVVSATQVEKLKRLKGATFRTTVPISGNPNHFFASGLEKPVF